MRRNERGQVLVVFVLFLTALLGASALVIDISGKYAAERRYRAVADAASLAGAQDLQQPGTRAVPTAVGYARARTDAMRVVLQDMVGTGWTFPTACGSWDGMKYTANIVNCSIADGTYTVSVYADNDAATPQPVCEDCTPERAVQVVVREPAHNLTFARLFGQTTWNLSQASVAGLVFGKAYTIVTLRPPQPLGGSGGFDVRDFRIEGGTKVHVINGDVGTNANMEYGGTGSQLYLDSSGYSMYYFDPYNGPEWAPPNPPDPTGQRIATMIADPRYVIPAVPGTAGGQDTNEAVGGTCYSEATYLLGTTNYGPYIPAAGAGVPDMGSISCYTPGFYSSDPRFGNDVAILEPSTAGLFYFGSGLTAGRSVIGGYRPDRAGVALVVPQDEELNLNLSFSGPSALALNAGSKFRSGGTGAEPSPAVDFAGNSIVTNGTPPVKMTLMVTRDPRCTVTFPYPLACDDTSNDTVKIAGNSDVYLGGVQFMPTDNSSINSSVATGYVGQVWAWTLKYSGGVSITEEGSSSTSGGTMRIDTGCSPGEPQSSCG